MNKPSITIWIDSATQMFKVDFVPQPLSPAEYGVAIASLIVHIAKLFAETNPDTPADKLVEAIQRGVAMGIENLRDHDKPTTTH